MSIRKKGYAKLGRSPADQIHVNGMRTQKNPNQTRPPIESPAKT